MGCYMVLKELNFLMNNRKKAVKVKDYEARMKEKSWFQRFLEWLEESLEKHGQYLCTCYEE